MKEYMALFDSDAHYADMLAHQLSGVPDFPFLVRAFSESPALYAFMAQERVRVLLADRKDADLMLHRITRHDRPLPSDTTELVPYGLPEDLTVICLTELQGGREADGKMLIGKYQPVSKIAAGIIEALRRAGEGQGGSVQKRGAGHLMLVGSPVGRCGKTTFSLILGQLLAEGSRVLYAGLEPCSAFESLFQIEGNCDLSDFLYAEETEKEDEGLREMILSFHGLDLIPPPRLPEDLYLTEAEKVKDLLERLIRIGGYDTVIVDAGACYRCTSVLLPLSNRIWLPTGYDDFSREKAELYREWIGRVVPDKVREIREVVLPALPGTSGRRVPAEQLLWSPAGDYVRAILREEGI